MDYDEVNSDHEARASTEFVKEPEIKNNGSSDDLDPLTEAFSSYHNLQQVLEKGSSFLICCFHLDLDGC